MAPAWSCSLQHCNTLCTFGFVDDVMFSYYGATGPESSTTLCLEGVHQVALPAGRQTTTVFGRVHQNVAQGQSLLSTIDLLLLVCEHLFLLLIQWPLTCAFFAEFLSNKTGWLLGCNFYSFAFLYWHEADVIWMYVKKMTVYHAEPRDEN